MVDYVILLPKGHLQVRALVLDASRVDSERQEGGAGKSEIQRDNEFEAAQIIEGILSPNISLDGSHLKRKG